MAPDRMPGGETAPRLPRLLLLDDVPEDAELAERTLRRAGLTFESRRVHRADGFEPALAEYAPDLVISDFSLPGLDGRGVLAVVSRVAPETPVIILSGTLGEDEAIETLKAGATDYVLKDRPGRLPPAVARALREAAGRRERRRAEQARRDSEALQQAVVAALGEGVLVVSPAGEILVANPRAESILGHDGLARLAGSARGDDSPLLDEQGNPLPPERSPLHRALGEGVATLDVVLGFAAAGSVQRWLSLSAQPLLREDGGAPHAAVLSFADISERRRLEADLRQSQKLESVGQLASGVAHDLNNLLTVITGFGELLRERTAGNAAAGQMIQEVLRAADRAALITARLLAFGRRQMLKPRVLDLGQVLADVQPMLRRLIREDIEMQHHAAAGLGAVRADPVQVEQILVNLAVNARDAMPVGGRLTFEVKNADLDEAYARVHSGVAPGSYVLLSVSDTGIGMSEEVRRHAFEPFFTTKAPGVGTGLGLATVWGIVSQSGGHVCVYSEVGRGTTFHVYLPRVDAVPSPEEAQPPAGARGGETVLLAEDEEQLRPLIASALEHFGYRVLVASDGFEALRRLDEDPQEVALLVTDMIMPGMGGRELSAIASQRRPGLRVLYLSGYADQAVLDAGLLEPGSDFLAKPFAIGDLARKVRGVLDRELPPAAG